MSWARIAGAALAAMLLAGAPPAQAVARVFRIDNDSATLAFRCDVLGMLPMKGRFTRFAAVITFDDARPANASANVIVDASSIAMDDATWLDEAKGEDFFDVRNHPRFDFLSQAATVEEPGLLAIHGILTLKGVKRPVTLHVRYDMPPDGTMPTLLAEAELDRSDFGMTALTPLLSDDVDIEVRGRLRPAFPSFRPWR